jgi:hypothetical protein
MCLLVRAQDLRAARLLPAAASLLLLRVAAAAPLSSPRRVVLFALGGNTLCASPQLDRTGYARRHCAAALCVRAGQVGGSSVEFEVASYRLS